MNAQQTRSVWMLLAQTWGARFLEQYGTTPNDAWAAALANIEPQAAKHALHKLIDEGSGFPPTLPEFVVHARTFRPVCPVVDINQGRARIEKQTTDPETAKRNIRMLRETLRGAGYLKPDDSA
jgi:hypothetical protein